MRLFQSANRLAKFGRDRLRFCARLIAFACLALLSACSQLERPQPKPYYAETQPPPKQVFRWSNGKLPSSVDPALATAPPETDIVRAVFEGLTELDPVTLQEVPAAAEKWSSSSDFKTWTFHIRENARWSNGSTVTAADFVRSWRRVAELGPKAAHHSLLNNIVGLPIKRSTAADVTPETSIPPQDARGADLPGGAANTDPAQPRESPVANTNSAVGRPAPASPVPPKIGVTALDERTLEVRLDLPDEGFPKLVAHPVLRPVFDGGRGLGGDDPPVAVVSNGAFRIVSFGPGGVTLERSGNYWNRDAVTLEMVRFVPREGPEAALAAYRAGEIDAVTNAEFSPLVLKLLEPYEDFRRTPHNSLNFYEINHRRFPYNDRRVREALSISIERERLTEAALEGATQPAHQFLPLFRGEGGRIVQDRERARQLIEDAGYPRGEGFPVVRLAVNRNDAQQRIARSVAGMWKRNLNIETELVVMEAAELEAARKARDFDVIRRGIVLPTVNETASFLAIFGEGIDAAAAAERVTNNSKSSNQNSAASANTAIETASVAYEDAIILTEVQALYEFRAIPLYYPTTYSLVKPYVSGFDVNGLDAPLLTTVRIDNEWQRK